MADRRLRRHLSQDEMNRGIGMLHSGLSQRHVANVLGVSQSVVSRMWNRFITTGNVRHLHAGGRERSTNEVQDRFLVVQARRHRFDNTTTLRKDFQNATDVRISTQTIRNRLHDAGLRSRRPAIRVPLTRYHVQMRLAWARDHVTWTQNVRQLFHHAPCNQHLYRSSDRLFLKNGIKFHNIRSGGLSAVCGGVVRR